MSLHSSSLSVGGKEEGGEEKKIELKKNPCRNSGLEGPLSQGEGQQQLCNSSCPGGTVPHAQILVVEQRFVLER